MVEVRIDYQGGLRCLAHHGPSGVELRTDAPVDNKGKGELFSPTDLLAVALGTCMETIMGITAEQKGVSLEGLRTVVAKHMSEDLPRRVERLDVDVFMPLCEDHPEKKLLQSSALGCPVLHSLHPEIKIPVRWYWLPPRENGNGTHEQKSTSKDMRSNGAALPTGSTETDENEAAAEKQHQEESPLDWLRRMSKDDKGS